ncbi:hypothetical protein ACFPRL_09305 [Pseudoclavibacter helvolus]
MLLGGTRVDTIADGRSCAHNDFCVAKRSHRAARGHYCDQQSRTLPRDERSLP